MSDALSHASVDEQTELEICGDQEKQGLTKCSRIRSEISTEKCFADKILAT